MTVEIRAFVDERYFAGGHGRPPDESVGKVMHVDEIASMSDAVLHDAGTIAGALPLSPSGGAVTPGGLARAGIASWGFRTARVYRIGSR